MIFKGVYWLYFEYYVYIRVAEKRVLVLNTLDYEKVVSDHPLIVLLCEKILEHQDRGGLEIDFDNEYKESVYQLFFNQIRDKFMGDLIPKQMTSGYPFQFPFTSKLNDESRNNSLFNYWGYDFLKNTLFTLNLYVNKLCEADCEKCSEYYKQFYCCSKLVKGESLSSENIDKLLGGCFFDNLNRINILGGNVSLYQNIAYLLQQLYVYRDKCYVYFNLENMGSIRPEYFSFFEDRVCVIADSKQMNLSSLATLRELKEKVSISFIVRDEGDLDRAQRLAKEESLHSYDFIPFFDGTNLSFFQQYVFVEEKDVFLNTQSIKQIHRNQLINNYFFGELTVFPNGDVSCGVNEPVLGSLERETILQLISKEVADTDSLWLKTRRKTSCKTCLYCDLCPSLSNYELVMDRFNLCHLNNGKNE